MNARLGEMLSDKLLLFISEKFHYTTTVAIVAAFKI
jgi:hypothetical protein